MDEHMDIRGYLIYMDKEKTKERFQQCVSGFDELMAKLTQQWE